MSRALVLILGLVAPMSAEAADPFVAHSVERLCGWQPISRSPATSALRALLEDITRPKIERILALRRAVLDAGLDRCQRLDHLTRFEAPPRPPPLYAEVQVGDVAGSRLADGLADFGLDPARKKDRRVAFTVGAVEVDGPCRVEAVQRVVARRARGLRYCYERFLKGDPTLRGRVTLAWTIDAKGGAGAVRIRASTLRSRAVEGCMARQIQRWRFPAPGASCRVTLPVTVAFPKIKPTPGTRRGSRAPPGSRGSPGTR